MPHSIAIVIPTYNEHANLTSIVQGIAELLPDARIVVVDDNSPDGTGQLADDLASTMNSLTVLHRPGKSGIGPAYVAGFRAALAFDTDLVAAMDADGSHSPADLMTMIEAAQSADLVIGSRYVAGGSTVGWPRSRRILSRFGGIYARTVLGAPFTDMTSGFKLYRRAALEAVPLSSLRTDGYGFQIETTWHVWKSGRTVQEVPITFHDRVAGKSKLSRRIVFEAMLMVWRLRFQRS